MITRISRRAVLSIIAAVLLIIGLAVPANAASNGIEGFVTDARTGAPVSGAWIQAHDSSGAGIGGAGTDENGHYDISWLRPGEYRLHVIATKYDEHWSDPVTSPGTASFALAPYEYGWIAGSFVRGPGQPVPDVRVELTDPNGNQRDQTATDASGGFRFPHVKTGEYKIRFFWPGSAEQWWPGQTDPYQAGIVTVTADQETVIDETALPTGDLEVTVTDSMSGAPVAGACVSSRDFLPAVTACADADGRARFDTIRARVYSFSISPPTGYLYGSMDDVLVRPNELGTASTTLVREAVFEVTFQDAATGAPVSDACVAVVDEAARGSVDPYHLWCSYGTGAIRIGMYWPGRYRLFAQPRDGVHGSQWVGAQGGTGNLERARWIELTPGVTAPVKIRLDRAGSITGTVTDAAAGTPVQGICPTVTPSNPWFTDPVGVTCTYTEGRYTISGLGPYEWRVQFPDLTGAYAWQWSGDKADRYAARPVAVTPGAVTTVDARLRPAGRVTGAVLGATIPYEYVSVHAINARTGDWTAPQGLVTLTGAYTLSGLNTQWIKITYSATSGDPLWHPRPVRVTEGHTTGLDLVVP